MAISKIPVLIRFDPELHAAVKAVAEDVGQSFHLTVLRACQMAYGIGEQPPAARSAPPGWRRQGESRVRQQDPLKGLVATEPLVGISPPDTPLPPPTPRPPRSQDFDVKPSECMHPITRRLGDGCGACGATVKGKP